MLSTKFTYSSSRFVLIFILSILNVTHFCKLCDKIMKRSSKFKHNKSFNHSCLQRCILRRYVMLDIDFDEVYDTVLKYIGSYCEKY